MVAHLSIIQGGAATDAELAEVDRIRPKTRGECEGQPGICPFISCRHHLLASVRRSGALSLNGIPNDSDDDAIIERLANMEHTCALDVVEENPDGMDRQAVGDILGLSRERVRHLERQTSAEALIEGFEPHFGERRPIADTAYGNHPVEGGRRSVNPVSHAYPKALRRQAVSHFRKYGDRVAAAELVFRGCGRRPSPSLINQWALKKRKSEMKERGQLTTKQATNRIMARVGDMLSRGSSHAEIANAVAGDYGRLPHKNTVARWCKILRGEL